MRIKAITISWFRGAADAVSLEPNCKSMVVYGANASGKSSFVDAIEYVLNDGKIRHLAHEYSGKRQEKAITNTHTPPGTNAELTIKLCDDSDHRVQIKADGLSKISGSSSTTIRNWNYRRTVLRQDEVGEFIHDTKGGKYSVLLPLFGLQELEVAAENLRQLGRNVESLSGLANLRTDLQVMKATRTSRFGNATDLEIANRIAALHAKHCPATSDTKGLQPRCMDLIASIESQLARFSADDRRHQALAAVKSLDFKKNVDDIRDSNAMLANSVDTQAGFRKLTVLQPTETLVASLKGDEEVECPACGRPIQLSQLRDHVTGELERLRETRSLLNTRNERIGKLCDKVKELKQILKKEELRDWRADLAAGKHALAMTQIEMADPEGIRKNCTETDLRSIEQNFIPIRDAASSASMSAPPDVTQLLNDKALVDAAISTAEEKRRTTDVSRLEGLIGAITNLEQSTRQQIKARCESVISDISDDIKNMWSTLHPDEEIEDVRLYIPKETDKAIDIGLKFHGKELDSPRMTLSEGYRNSLGLCIFLAMAKRDAAADHAVFLDDVVTSLDRNHRGMIVELLAKEFGSRQVIILTHDRDWYVELHQQLDEKDWIFKTLLPYATPKLGIRWSHKTTTFDDARAQLKDRPDSAGNDARKIMDVELAIAAERLRLRLPFKRLDKNDRRLAHEFLERLIADGEKYFQREGPNYTPFVEAIEGFRTADKLLISWANRASHNFDLVLSEAAKLIEVCEKCLEYFQCSKCRKKVWVANYESSGDVQCQCGNLRWRYGKG
jgi:recombinational DNA repair ATPase RecF